ncbi:endo-alpha-N-acetylgalactosaminidase family protein (plasmid) [Bacillus sp. F19]|nr:endo-alpha-N-acetylgalactosaminidase family protein [Bacillus sp. F19]
MKKIKIPVLVLIINLLFLQCIFSMDLSFPNKVSAVENSSFFSISSKDLKVTLDSEFPRVIEYEWLANGAKLYGQSEKLSTVKINGEEYDPEVKVRKKKNQAEYTLYFEPLKVEINMIVQVKNNVLEIKAQKIKEKGSFKVETIEIPNHRLLSIRSNQEEAKAATVDIKSWNGTDEKFFDLKDYNPDPSPVPKTYIILNTSELSASIYNNAFDLLPEDNKEASNIYEKRYYYQVLQKDNYKELGVWNYPWTYREVHNDKEEKIELPYSRIVITADQNKDGDVSWQDGAIGYRDIMEKPKGADVIRNTIPHIAYTRASLAQWPFTRTLDMVKKQYLYTDGFGQLLQYKGHQAEGHDSNHPDYGVNINPKAGGLKDFNTLVNVAEKYNTYVGVHLNHTEIYPEAKYFSYDLARPVDGWNSLDLSKKINRYNDALDSGPTGFAARVKELKDNVPNLKWIYWDVYDGVGYSQWKLAKEVMDNGLFMGSEFGGALERYSIWYHVPKQTSKVTRFIKNHVTDSYFYDPMLLESRHAGSMGYGDDKNEDQGVTGQTINEQIAMFYTNNLIFKYMQHHEIEKWTENQEVLFNEGLQATVVDKGQPEETKEYQMINPIVELKKDGKLIAKYQKQFKRFKDNKGALTLNKETIPQFTQIFIPWSPEEENKIYHWNSEGGTTTWELPESWKKEKKVTLYQLTDTGKRSVTKIDVKDQKVTIVAQKNTPYVLYKEKSNDPIRSLEKTNFGEGGLVKDPGFDSRTFDNWKVTSTNDKKDHVQIKTNAAGDAYLEVKGNNGEGAVLEQKIKGLKGGKTYQASVWAEVENGRTATIGVKDYGDKEVYNVMEKSDIPNGYYNTLMYSAKTKLQRLKVEFTVPKGHGSAYLYLKANAVGDSNSASASFDNIRIIEIDRTAKGEHYFFEDFESNEEGWGPFVPVKYVNRAHLSETHTGFTSDTINGKYSFKFRETNANPETSEAVRTLPINVKLEPNTTYTVSFPYWLKTDKSYSIAVTSGFGKEAKDLFEDKLDYSKFYYHKTFTTGPEGDYVFRILKNVTGMHDFVLDDFTVDKGSVELPKETVPDQDFNDGDLKEWTVAYGNGDIEPENNKMLVKTDRYQTVALDANTNDIADGEVDFTLSPKNKSMSGVIIRYTSPESYTRIGYDSESDGWRYWDAQGHTGILNMPGIPLKYGIEHKIKLKYTGSHYKLVVDGITLFDGEIPELKTTPGRSGFEVRNKSEVYIDNVTIKNIGEDTGKATPITHVPIEIIDEDGKINIDSSDDAFVRDGGFASINFGSDSKMESKLDSPGYVRESFVKFNISQLEAKKDRILSIKLKLYMTIVGQNSPNQQIMLLNSDQWDESTLTWSNKPESMGTTIAQLIPKQGIHEIDITQQVNEAIQQNDKELSFRLSGTETRGGESFVFYGTFENSNKEFRPVIEVKLKE